MRYHISLKFVAVLLCACCLFCAIASGVGIGLTAAVGLYAGDVDSVRHQRMELNLQRLAEVLATRYAAAALSNCPQAFILQYSESWYTHMLEEGLYAYTLEDEDADVLQSTLDASFAGADTYEFLVQPEYPVILAVTPDDGSIFSAELLPTVPGSTEPSSPTQNPEYLYISHVYLTDETTGESYRYEVGVCEGPLYLVTMYLMPGAYAEETGMEWVLMEWGHRYRFWMIGIFAASLLLFAANFVYLCCAAGRKPGTDEVRPGGLNRLPLDVYLGVTACGVITLGVLGYELFWDFADYVIPGIFAYSVGGLLGSLLIVGLLFAVAAQSKLPGGYWWRNSLLGLVLRSCVWLVKAIFHGFGTLVRRFCRGVNRLISLLPLVWQWVALIGIGLLLGIISFALASEWVLIFSLLFCLGVAAYVVLAFSILAEGARRMSMGNLNTKVSTRFLVGCFRDFANYLNALADVAVVAAQKQMKSERMKAELVTNVSHDIKTPLTSIINYVDLLQKATNQEEAQQYLEVLGRQSQRMKKLIEDLMEMSKASTGNMPVEITQVDAAEAILQALGEFSDKLDAARLTPIFQQPQAPVAMLADGRLAWRVLSNLLSNAVKYALPGTRLYVDLVQLEDQVLISLKNISREQLNISSEELTERFVRGDASRNTEGSGLGLNIAQSLMELQRGSLQLLVDGDLFKATLIFPRVPE